MVFLTPENFLAVCAVTALASGDPRRVALRSAEDSSLLSSALEEPKGRDVGDECTDPLSLRTWLVVPLDAESRSLAASLKPLFVCALFGTRFPKLKLRLSATAEVSETGRANAASSPEKSFATGEGEEAVEAIGVVLRLSRDGLRLHFAWLREWRNEVAEWLRDIRARFAVADFAPKAACVEVCSNKPQSKASRLKASEAHHGEELGKAEEPSLSAWNAPKSNYFLYRTASFAAVAGFLEHSSLVWGALSRRVICAASAAWINALSNMASAEEAWQSAVSRQREAVCAEGASSEASFEVEASLTRISEAARSARAFWQEALRSLESFCAAKNAASLGTSAETPPPPLAVYVQVGAPCLLRRGVAGLSSKIGKDAEGGSRGRALRLSGGGGV